MIESLFGIGFFQNLIASAAWLIGAWVLRWVYAKLAPRRWIDPRLQLVLVAVPLLIWVAIDWLRFGGQFTGWAGWIGLLMLTVLWGHRLLALERVGIVGVDTRIAGGLSYSKALSLCNNSLIFAGIGASKLTSSPEFEDAVRRCHRDKSDTLMFLLVRPSSEFLSKAAQLAGKTQDEYQRRVRASLRVLADLKAKGFNIKVRFMRRGVKPLFRLMFVDEDLCLLSYNVFGEGDGSQLPQLNINRRGGSERDVGGFFHPFRQYFAGLWSAAEEWNFEDELTTNP